MFIVDYALFIIYTVHFYIYFVTLSSFAVQEVCLLIISLYFLRNKRGYAPFKTHMVHFHISFENLASSATQGFIFLENQCTFLENKKKIPIGISFFYFLFVLINSSMISYIFSLALVIPIFFEF